MLVSSTKTWLVCCQCWIFYTCSGKIYGVGVFPTMGTYKNVNLSYGRGFFPGTTTQGHIGGMVGIRWRSPWCLCCSGCVFPSFNVTGFGFADSVIWLGLRSSYLCMHFLRLAESWW